MRDLRWFLLPSEAYDWLNNPQHAATKPRISPPFTPITYPRQEVPTLRKIVPSNTQDVPTLRKIVPPDTRVKNTNVGGDSTQCCDSKHNDSSPSNENDLSKARGDFHTGLTQNLTEGFTQDSSLSTQNTENSDSNSRNPSDQGSTVLVPQEKPSLFSNCDKSVNSGPNSAASGPIPATSGPSLATNGPNSGEKRPPDRGTVCEKSSKIQKTSPKSDMAKNTSDTHVITKEISQENNSAHSTETEPESNVKGEKKGFICLDGACLQKRTTNAIALPDAPGGKHKWRSPPKHIFKPTTQVSERSLFTGTRGAR